MADVPKSEGSQSESSEQQPVGNPKDEAVVEDEKSGLDEETIFVSSSILAHSATSAGPSTVVFNIDVEGGKKMPEPSSTPPASSEEEILRAIAAAYDELASSQLGVPHSRQPSRKGRRKRRGRRSHSQRYSRSSNESIEDFVVVTSRKNVLRDPLYEVVGTTFPGLPEEQPQTSPQPKDDGEEVSVVCYMLNDLVQFLEGEKDECDDVGPLKEDTSSENLVQKAARKTGPDAPLIQFSSSATMASEENRAPTKSGKEPFRVSVSTDDSQSGPLVNRESTTGMYLRGSTTAFPCWHDLLVPIEMVSEYIQTDWCRDDSSFSEFPAAKKSSTGLPSGTCPVKSSRQQRDESSGSSAEELDKIFAGYLENKNEELSRADVKGMVNDKTFKGVSSTDGVLLVGETHWDM